MLSETPDVNPFGGVHDVTHSIYVHYIICQFYDYVYGLMTLVCLPGLVFTALLWTYFMYIIPLVWYLYVLT